MKQMYAESSETFLYSSDNVHFKEWKWTFLILLTDLTSVLAELSSKEKQDECVAHALKLRTAWSLQNYKRFFQSYLQAPKMSGYLIDWFVARERKAALRIMLRAYVLIRTITAWLFIFIIFAWVKGKQYSWLPSKIISGKISCFTYRHFEDGKYK